jgi:hypothetical protein
MEITFDGIDGFYVFLCSITQGERMIPLGKKFPYPSLQSLVSLITQQMDETSRTNFPLT